VALGPILSNGLPFSGFMVRLIQRNAADLLSHKVLLNFLIGRFVKNLRDFLGENQETVAGKGAHLVMSILPCGGLSRIGQAEPDP